ncbi:MAG: serine/threonine-protein kinase [Actinomycetota bacterium]
MKGPSPGLPGYVVEAALGRGAMGSVHRARRAGWAGRVVALKRVPRGGPGLAAALRSEAEALAALDHPHIVRILDLVPDGDGVAIAMQYAPGGSLEALLRRRGWLSAGEVVAVAAPLADALASAHRRGLVHCDVKPANVLFTSDGEPLLCDFGLARRAASPAGGRPPARPSGTAEYFDPAVAGGRGPDERSDVYSLGAVCYEMLAGRPPFEGATAGAVLAAAAAGAFDPLASAAPGTPAPLAAAVERALARHPDDRFATAAAFGSALRAAVPHARSPLAPADPTTRGAEGSPASHPAGRRPPAPLPPPGPAAASHPAHPAGPAAAASHPAGHPPPPLPPPGPAVDPRHPSCYRPPPPTSAPLTVPPEPPAGPAGTSDPSGPDEPEHPIRRPTRSFGPRPPRPAGPPPSPSGHRRPRLARTAPLVVGVAAVLVAAGTLAAGAGPGPQRPEAVTVAATRPAGAACDPIATPLSGDLDGDGCDTAVSWRGNVVEAAGIRYHLGRPGDVLLLGDWDCDRRDTPALYRPATGQVFIFPAWAGQGPALAGTDAGRHPTAGEATVVRGPDGCDQVAVSAPPPPPAAPRS